MDRSIGFKRTRQPKQYETVEVSSFVSGIPIELWSDEAFIENLYKLITVQAYKAFSFEGALLVQLSEQTGAENRLAYLNKLEQELIEAIDLKELKIETQKEIIKDDSNTTTRRND